MRHLFLILAVTACICFVMSPTIADACPKCPQQVQVLSVPAVAVAAPSTSTAFSFSQTSTQRQGVLARFRAKRQVKRAVNQAFRNATVVSSPVAVQSSGGGAASASSSTSTGGSTTLSVPPVPVQPLRLPSPSEASGGAAASSSAASN